MSDKNSASEKTGAVSDRSKNNVRVSAKRSKFLYADLAKHLLHDGEKEIVITALNQSISNAVAIVEMLKTQNAVTVTKIETSRGTTDASRPNSDKIEIRLVKSKDFDKVYADQLKERETKKAEKEGANGKTA